jgi:hypothetical protein
MVDNLRDVRTALEEARVVLGFYAAKKHILILKDIGRGIFERNCQNMTVRGNMIKKSGNLTVQLPPTRVLEQTAEALERDREDEIARTGITRKLSAHIRWILEKHLTEKKVARK